MYVSLAITHSENGDLEKALEYYRKELEIRKAAGFTKDFKEVCFYFSVLFICLFSDCLQIDTKLFDSMRQPAKLSHSIFNIAN